MKSISRMFMFVLAISGGLIFLSSQRSVAFGPNIEEEQSNAYTVMSEQISTADMEQLITYESMIADDVLLSPATKQLLNIEVQQRRTVIEKKQFLHLKIIDAKELALLGNLEREIEQSGLPDDDKNLLLVELFEQRRAIEASEKVAREKAEEERKKVVDAVKKQFSDRINDAKVYGDIIKLDGDIRNDARLNEYDKNEMLLQLASRQEKIIAEIFGQDGNDIIMLCSDLIEEEKRYDVEAIPVVSRGIPPTMHGIANVNSSCFLNAVIQQLYRYPEFRAHLCEMLSHPAELAELKRNHGGNDFVIYYNLMKIFEALENGLATQENIEMYVNVIRCILYPQSVAHPDNAFRRQDADEFLGQICNRLKFHDLFSIITAQGLTNRCAVNVQFVREIAPGTSLLNALELSLDLGVQNRFKDLLPQTMMITLQRFTTLADGSTEKLRDEINLDDEIVLRDAEGFKRYRLKGIVVHRGTEASDGHYVSYVRDGDQWGLLNDDTVSVLIRSIGDIEELRKDAYILRYERV